MLQIGSFMQDYEVFQGILKPNQEKDMTGNFQGTGPVTSLGTANMKQINPVSNQQAESNLQRDVILSL